MPSDRPTPEGRLLFRFCPPKMTEDQRATSDVCDEYAVTAIDIAEYERVLPPHARIIIWGWLRRQKRWEANVSARPVVFELLKRLRDGGAILPDLLSPGGARIRMPGEPTKEPPMPTDTRELIARARQAERDDREYLARGGRSGLLKELADALQKFDGRRELWESAERLSEKS